LQRPLHRDAGDALQLFHQSLRRLPGEPRRRLCDTPHVPPLLTCAEDRGVWGRVKGFLMPRRHYGGVEELREAVVQALKALGGVELKILGEGT
ncbi:MAG: hypothetical protein ABWJ90_05765, partial [Thermus sp.]